MHVPLSAKIFCEDSLCGDVAYVIVDPVTQQVTHLVMRQKEFPHTQRLIPVDRIASSTSRLIHLHCTPDELEMLEPFVETEYVQNGSAYSIPMANHYGLWPYLIPESMRPAERMHLAAGELAIQHGAHVQAADGYVGQVIEFLIDSANQHITDLVFRGGHKIFIIPVSEIARLEADTIYLELDQRSVEAFATDPATG